MTRLPVKPASAGSSLSMAGCGPATRRRPSSRSVRSRSRCLALAPERSGPLSGTSSLMMAYHMSFRSAGRFALVPGDHDGQPDALDHHEGEGHSQQSEEFEADPGALAETVGDEDVGRARDAEEYAPDHGQLTPLSCGKFHGGLQQPLDEGFLADVEAAEAHRRHGPVQEGGLPDQEQAVAQRERDGAED